MILLEARLLADGGDQSDAQILLGMRHDHDPRPGWVFEDVV
ncbi:hypothetical protein Amal_03634 [Acetobacter malorum]|uniref:Uncharacterized protein n=1 Tax=Acetobacter malorum TaxID=178901 RepID=A0A177G4H3_9PROT|nr:hypothetical protein Amal_03634 [Acetobacter malorum]